MKKRNKYEELVYRCTVDPNVSFCEKILNSPNDIWQAEMMDAIADLDRARFGLPTKYNHDLKTRFTIAAMHGCGKTHFVAKVMHWYNFTRRGRIPCTAPKEKQLTTRTWPEFRKILSHAKDEYRSLINVDTKHIQWFNDVDWCAIVETASHPDNLAGYHDKNLLFICEETSGISQAMFPVIEGALTTEGALLIMIGNPTRNQGEFYDSHKKQSSAGLYYRKQIKHHETKRVSQKWVDDMTRKYGVNSPVVKIRVFGEFADSASNQLISVEWLYAAFERELNDGSHPQLRISCDVAAGGVDDTIIWVTEIYHTFTKVIKQLRFSFNADTAVADTRQACEDTFHAYGGDASQGDDIVIDSVGVGDGAGAELVKSEYNVIRYKGGEQSDDPKMWRNRRVQSYMVYRDAFRDGTICFEEGAIDVDDMDEFIAQHTSVLTKNADERLEDLETKKEMLARGEKSPDMADCGSQVFATQTPISYGSTETEVIGEIESIHEEF